jgi:hypothetical protein
VHANLPFVVRRCHKRRACLRRDIPASLLGTSCSPAVDQLPVIGRIYARPARVIALAPPGELRGALDDALGIFRRQAGCLARGSAKCYIKFVTRWRGRNGRNGDACSFAVKTPDRESPGGEKGPLVGKPYGLVKSDVTTNMVIVRLRMSRRFRASR